MACVGISIPASVMEGTARRPLQHARYSQAGKAKKPILVVMAAVEKMPGGMRSTRGIFSHGILDGLLYRLELTRCGRHRGIIHHHI
jgi:hypothetical protein